MNLSFRSFTGAGLLLSTAIATASPIVLDTEQYPEEIESVLGIELADR